MSLGLGVNRNLGNGLSLNGQSNIARSIYLSHLFISWYWLLEAVEEFNLILLLPSLLVISAKYLKCSTSRTPDTFLTEKRKNHLVFYLVIFRSKYNNLNINPAFFLFEFFTTQHISSTIWCHQTQWPAGVNLSESLLDGCDFGSILLCVLCFLTMIVWNDDYQFDLYFIIVIVAFHKRKSLLQAIERVAKSVWST